MKKKKKKKNHNCDDDENNSYPLKIKDISAGAHFSVALDESNHVWTFGRNACVQLGRYTKKNSPKIDFDTKRPIRQELCFDLPRMVSALKPFVIDWVACAAKCWFAHNAINGHVYAFGDAGEGACGLGKWRAAMGRCVFDQRNLDTTKYEVKMAAGGDNHSLFAIFRKNHNHNHNHNLNLNQLICTPEITPPNVVALHKNYPAQVNDNPFLRVPTIADPKGRSKFSEFRSRTIARTQLSKRVRKKKNKKKNFKKRPLKDTQNENIRSTKKRRKM